MKRHARGLIGITLAAALLIGSAAEADVPSPTPSPPVAASPIAAHARAAKATEQPERLVIATCSRTLFYSWPVRDGVPSPANYPPATTGDAFHIVGGPQLAYGGQILYETTIDVVEPWGAGKHYWVRESCVNAG
jgi:hypothetical protein